MSTRVMPDSGSASVHAVPDVILSEELPHKLDGLILGVRLSGTACRLFSGLG